MKQVTIVGVGLSAGTLTREGAEALARADLILGAPRLIEALAEFGKPSVAAYQPEEITRCLASQGSGRYCIAVSGDTGFFSAARGLSEALADCEVSWLPGISSLNALFARLRRPWQEAALVSCHGREANLVDTIRRSRLTFALTGQNLAVLGEALTAAGFGRLTATLGENLGLPDERLSTVRLAELADMTPGSLAVLLVENPRADDRIPCGLPDESFLRGKVPMTKSEVRALTLSRLALAPDSVCCDIGAGTGSVTVEMALASYRGRVFALERSEEALRLIRENCRRFHLGNVSVLPGEAAQSLGSLPRLDAAFIGGSAGQLTAIIDALMANNPRIRIVLNAVTLETVQEALDCFQAHGLEPDIVQLAVTRTRLVGRRHMLEAATPVFVMAGGGTWIES